MCISLMITGWLGMERLKNSCGNSMELVGISFIRGKTGGPSTLKYEQSIRNIPENVSVPAEIGAGISIAIRTPAHGLLLVAHRLRGVD